MAPGAVLKLTSRPGADTVNAAMAPGAVLKLTSRPVADAGRGTHTLERKLKAFVLVSKPVLTTSTHEIAWPQGDQFLVGGM